VFSEAVENSNAVVIDDKVIDRQVTIATRIEFSNRFKYQVTAMQFHVMRDRVHWSLRSRDALVRTPSVTLQTLRQCLHPFELICG